MVNQDLPHRVDLDLLHNICIELKNGNKEENILKNKLDGDTRKLNRTIEYGQQLGFLVLDEDTVGLSRYGNALSYVKNTETEGSAEDIYQDAIEGFTAYRTAIILAFEEDLFKNVRGNKSLLKSDIIDVMDLENGDERLASENAITLIKTAEAAGLGDYKVGRRSYESRLVISEKFTEFAKVLSSDYPAEKEDGEIESKQGEKEVSIEERGTGVRLLIEIDPNGFDETEVKRILEKLNESNLEKQPL